MAPLILELIRPYRGWLIIVFIAMLFETAMSIAAPWPLKIIIDNVVGKHKLPEFLAWLRDFSFGEHTMALAGVAAAGAVVIALIGAVAGYIDNYYTESVAQYVANDLRHRLYHHLQRLALKYYDTHQIGNMLSTITSDVGTIQSFASTALLSILVDSLTIIGMVGVMLYLNFDFALIAVGVTPFLLLFVARFKKAVKKATHEVRKRQSDIVGVLQQGLESVRTVEAFGRQDTEEERLDAASMESVKAALKARRVKSLLSPIVSVTVSLCVAFVLWRGAGLILSKAMTIGALTVFLSYLNKFFKPVQDLATMTNVIAQAQVGMERIQAILDADTIIPQKPDARDPGKLKGEIVFEHVAFAYDPAAPVLRDINLTIKPGQRIGVCGPTGGGKSTVLSLIPRFYDPTAGRVLIDGVDVTDYKLDPLRAQIGFRLAGHRPLRRHDPRQHRLRPARRDAGGDHRRGEDGQRARFHLADAARLRLAGRRARPDALGRPAAAHRHRPRRRAQLAHPHPRRTDRRARHRVGEGRDGSARTPDERPHRHHHRAPLEHHPRRRQDRRAQRRLRRRGRHARRTHQAQRNLRRTLPHPGRRHARARSSRRRSRRSQA